MSDTIISFAKYLSLHQLLLVIAIDKKVIEEAGYSIDDILKRRVLARAFPSVYVYMCVSLRLRPTNCIFILR